MRRKYYWVMPYSSASSYGPGVCKGRISHQCECLGITTHSVNLHLSSLYRCSRYFALPHRLSSSPLLSLQLVLSLLESSCYANVLMTQPPLPLFQMSVSSLPHRSPCLLWLVSCSLFLYLFFFFFFLLFYFFLFVVVLVSLLLMLLLLLLS